MQITKEATISFLTSQRKKWRAIWLISIATLLGMGVWFSASAVVPSISVIWNLNDSGRAWLTMSVQVGFVVGSLGSAILSLPDRISSRLLFSIASILAGFATALIPLISDGLGSTLILRFMSGMVLAGVYPVGMKIMSTWTKEDRGYGIGLLVGALTIGSAAPHLITVFGGVSNWQVVLFIASGMAILGGLLGLVFVEEGPYKAKSPAFNWKYAGIILREREIALANLGYLGHMWELFAMWAWIPVFLGASFRLSGQSAGLASLAAFAVIAVGGLGSLTAGKLADKFGRKLITMASLAISSGSAVITGLLFGGNPIILVGISLIWGFSVVADSAQFSACVSELADQEYIGTAITLQTSLGFLLTLITIRLIPTFVSWVGWQWAFSSLTVGPMIGIAAMYLLRRSPRAIQLANGKR